MRPLDRIDDPVEAPAVEEIERTDVAVAPPWMTVLHNCDCHTFDEVVKQLMKAIGCSEDKGWELAWQVHNTGRAVVKVGPETECVRVVLHSGSRHVSGLVVHQGVLDRRQIVVPIAKVSSFGDEVRLTLSASGLAGLDLYNAESLQLMPDQWEMPAGFDQREFFLVGGDGWTEAVLPFERTSSRPRRSSAPPRTQLERR